MSANKRLRRRRKLSALKRRRRLSAIKMSADKLSAINKVINKIKYEALREDKVYKYKLAAKKIKELEEVLCVISTTKDCTDAT